jgi:predicted nucleic acid-binding protein
MQPVLFDFSIYITALRAGDEGALALRRLAADAPVWLSSVVLEELYAGVESELDASRTRGQGPSREATIGG